MTRDEQSQFVLSIMQSVQNDVLKHIAKEVVPPHWDGYELRQYLADIFAREVCIKMSRKRKADYNNTMLVTNL